MAQAKQNECIEKWSMTCKPSLQAVMKGFEFFKPQDFPLGNERKRASALQHSPAEAKKQKLIDSDNNTDNNNEFDVSDITQ